ncbi:MAG TPA: hypothetical protein VGI75_06810 [Pirellulales bacterium]
MLMKMARASALLAAAVVILNVRSAWAQTSATGSVTATPSGANFLYTISLHNTGTTNIDTFWFSWLPDNYDFLPSVPTPTGMPANWSNFVETGFYGSSIEFFGPDSAGITPGQTSSAFQFLSPDSPTALAGNNSLFPFPVTYSYVYAGSPAGPGQDPVSSSSVIFSMPVTTVAPEPGSLALAGIGGTAMLLMFWRSRNWAMIQQVG